MQTTARVSTMATTLVLTIAPWLAGAQEAPPKTHETIAGAWTLSRELSDDLSRTALARGRPGGPSSAPAGGGAGGGGRGRDGGSGAGGGTGGDGILGPGDMGAAEGTNAQLNPEDVRKMLAMLQEVLKAADRLTITVADRAVTFMDAEGRGRRFTPDNKKAKHQLTSGTVETRTKWTEEGLVKETSLLGLATVKETFTVTRTGHLQVEVKVERVRVPGSMSFKRVYESAPAK